MIWFTESHGLSAVLICFNILHCIASCLRTYSIHLLRSRAHGIWYMFLSNFQEGGSEGLESGR